MSTTVRPNLSEGNKYYIKRHRYYELKHFCLQYFDWKDEYTQLDPMAQRADYATDISGQGRYSDPTANCAEKRAKCLKKIELLENVAELTDPVIGPYILKHVTQGLSYDQARALYSVPCSKDVYYELYRRFFWLLDKERD